MLSIKRIVFCTVLVAGWFVGGALGADKIVKVSDYGAVGDGKTDDGDAIRRAIEAAVKLGSGASVVFDKPSYRMESNANRRAHFEFFQNRDLTVDGNGAALLLNPRHAAFNINRCTNVVVRGFSIDYDPMTFTQGTITAVDPASGTFDLDIHDGYPLPPADDFLKERIGGWHWGTVIDPVGRHRRWGMADHFFIESVNALENRVYRVKVTAHYAPQLKPVNNGDRFFLPLFLNEAGQRIHGSNIMVTESVDCTVEDVAIYSARSGMNYLLSRNEGRVTLRNTRIDFKPGSQHICSTWRDGVHCKDNRVGPLIEGCYYEGMLDDSINISANTSMAQEIVSESEFVLVGARFGVGDKVMVFDPVSGEITANTKVVKAQAAGRNTRVTLAHPVQGVITGTKRARADIRATHFYNMDYINDGFVVRNCIFKPQRRHALLVRCCNGVFENNLVDGVGGSAVWMSNESGGFYEGPFPQNNVIRSNTILNTQLPAIHIDTVTLKGGVKHTRDITIEDNTITPLAGSPAIQVHRAENIVLRANHLLDQSGRELGAEAVKASDKNTLRFE